MTKATATKSSAATQRRRSRGAVPRAQPSSPEDRLRTVTKNTPFKPRKESSISLAAHMKLLSLTETTAPSLTPAQRLLALSLAAQERHMPNPQYLAKVQRDEIKGVLRYEVLEWVLRMNKKLEYHPETFAVAANLFDRLLSLVKVKALHVQLIGATCFLLAAKMHEVWNTHPSLDELVSAGGMQFSCNDLERMEKLVLLKLQWALNPPTAHLLVHQLLPLTSLAPDTHPTLVHVAESALERVVLCERFLQYPPSVQAACALMRGVAHGIGGVSRDQVEHELLALTHVPREMYAQCSSDMDMLMISYAPML